MLISSGVGRANSLVQFITVLILFIVVLIITAYTTRFIGHYQNLRQANSNIEVLDGYRLNSNKYIQIIKVGSRIFLVAICKDTVTLISELNSDDIVMGRSKENMNIASFKEIFDKTKRHLFDK